MENGEKGRQASGEERNNNSEQERVERLFVFLIEVSEKAIEAEVSGREV